MKLLAPPPPSRAGLLPPVLLMPGASDASALNVRFRIGRFSTASAVMVNERSPLCDWMSGASAVTLIVSAAPADVERERLQRHPVARAHRHAGPLRAGEPRHRDLDRVGAGRDVRKHVVAGTAGDSGGQHRPLPFVRQGHGRAGDHASLAILDGAGHRSRAHLGPGVRGDHQSEERHRARGAEGRRTTSNHKCPPSYCQHGAERGPRCLGMVRNNSPRTGAASRKMCESRSEIF